MGEISGVPPSSILGLLAAFILCGFCCAVTAIGLYGNLCFIIVIHYFHLTQPLCFFFLDHSQAVGRGERMLYMYHLGLSAPESLFSLCWPFMVLCINHHLPQKEVFLMRVERCTHIKDIKIKSWGQFNITSIYQNKSKFSLKAYDLSRHGFGAQLMIPDINDIEWRGL